MSDIDVDGKSSNLNIRVRDDELERWREAAALDGRSLSGWVRHALNRLTNKPRSKRPRRT